MYVPPRASNTALDVGEHAQPAAGDGAGVGRRLEHAGEGGDQAGHRGGSEQDDVDLPEAANDEGDEREQADAEDHGDGADHLADPTPTEFASRLLD